MIKMISKLQVDRAVFSIDDPQLKMKDAVPNIRDAIGVALENRLWVFTEKIPYCMMEGDEYHIKENYYEQDPSDFKLGKVCSTCVYKDVCDGISTEYLDIYGEDEFSAVKESKHVEDIRDLKNEKG